MGADEVLTRDNRPPTYAEALDLFRQGRALVEEVQARTGGDERVLGSDVLTGDLRDKLLHAHVLFAGAGAAASLRLVAPVHFPTTGVTDTGRSVR